MRGGERLAFPLIGALALFGCVKKVAPEAVWVDVAGLSATVSPVRKTVPPPVPPERIPARTASLPARPAARLVAQAGIDGAELAREVDEAQAKSLKNLRRKLSEVYRREADRFARAQIRALGDPYRKATLALYPAFRKKFEAYAAKRAYPAAVLFFAVGRNDPDKEIEGVLKLSTDPYGKLLFKRAHAARTELMALDAAFKGVEEAWVESIQSQGDAAKAATFASIESNRDTLNRQALAEATLNLGPRGTEAIELRLARRGVAVVPAVPARVAVLPAVAPPLPAPVVESPKALTDARSRLLGEARIWAAQSGFRLDPKGRDATSEFERWKEKRAGASPKSPNSSAGP